MVQKKAHSRAPARPHPRAHAGSHPRTLAPALAYLKFPKFLDPLFKGVKNYQWWELTLFAMGLISFIGVFTLMFLPVGKGPDLFQATNPMPAVNNAQFMATISNAMTVPIDHGPPVEVLVDGEAFEKALIADIDAAKRTINVMVYIWNDGALSDKVLAHLKNRQHAGVQVRVMYDAYGGMQAPKEKFAELEELGAKVVPFNSLVPLPWNLVKAPKRNHRRSIVIDGLVGYTGGAAIDDIWLGRARNPDEWHDVMFRMRGTMASRLQGSFAEPWAVTTGELLIGESFYPAAPVQGDISYITLSTSPSADLFEAETFFLLSLLGARHEIKIETPYFLPDKSLRTILKAKARSGVAVTIIVPNEETDAKYVRWAGQRIYEELLEAGVKIYEYQPTFTHAKFFIEDGTWSVIGSANMDARSRKINDEILIGVHDATLAKTLDEVFAADLARSKAITLEEWRDRGLWQRSLEIISQVFVQQY